MNQANYATQTVVAPLPAAPVLNNESLQAGTTLFGEYEIIGKPLGGGMGNVFKCLHRRFNELRAIKVIRPELQTDSKKFEQLFVQEAKSLKRVKHNAIVECHDLLSDGKQLFLVMEFVDGPSLSERIKQRPLSPIEVLKLRSRIASGLAAVHAAGVVHRDIAPDNILLPEGRVELAKLIDFGVASCTAFGVGTIAGEFKGKLAYASPEQFGLFGGAIGDRSDIYSLGLVLAEAACGSQVPMGQTLFEAGKRRQSIPTLPASMPAGLEEYILPMLSPDPNKRPSAQEIAESDAGEDSAEPEEEEHSLGIGSAITGGLLLGAAFYLMKTFGN